MISYLFIVKFGAKLQGIFWTCLPCPAVLPVTPFQYPYSVLSPFAIITTLMDWSKLADFAKTNKEIEVIYLFGSRATGRENQLSDYDFALLLDDKEVKTRDKPSFYHRKQLFYIHEIGSLIESKEIDVLILNEASPRVIHQVLKYGKAIYEKGGSLRATFEASAYNIYLDYKYYYDIEDKYLLDRIKKGTFGKEAVLVGR